MPEKETRKNIWAVLFFETLGTMFLIYFTITGDQDNAAIAAAFFGCYLLFAPISRGHFNPAVSLGVYLAELAEGEWCAGLLHFLFRCIAQIVGGVLGALLAYVVLARTRESGDYNVAPQFIPHLCPEDAENPSNCDKTGNAMWQMISTQSFTTFVFVLTFIIIRKPATRPSKDEIAQAFALAVVFFGLTHIGNHNGASFNPAMSMAMLFFEWIATAKDDIDENWARYLWGYMIGPLIGAGAAALFFWFIACAGLDDQEEDEEEAQPKKKEYADDKDLEAQEGLLDKENNDQDTTGGADKTGAEKTGAEKTGADKTGGADKTKTDADKTKTSGDKTGADKTKTSKDAINESTTKTDVGAAGGKGEILEEK